MPFVLPTAMSSSGMLKYFRSDGAQPAGGVLRRLGRAIQEGKEATIPSLLEDVAENESLPEDVRTAAKVALILARRYSKPIGIALFFFYMLVKPMAYADGDEKSAQPTTYNIEKLIQIESVEQLYIDGNEPSGVREWIKSLGDGSDLAVEQSLPAK